jgi:hypothetical protein
MLQRLQLALGADGLDETACAVCNRFVLRKSSCLVDVADRDRIDKMR